MVLDADEVEAGLVGRSHHLAVLVQRVRVGDDGDTDLHAASLMRRTVASMLRSS